VTPFRPRLSLPAMPDCILLTGATGFVGSRLHDVLDREGLEVRCLTRRPEDAIRRRRGWQWVGGDVGSPRDLARAMEGCRAAFYLVHGMAGARPGWQAQELELAQTFARAAARARLERVIYLGGMAPRSAPSPHLQSRLATGAVLRAGPVPCLELRATMIIGHGSASWQMVRDLAARLPVMILPAWLRNRTEPVAIDDVLAALARAVTLPLQGSAWADLPGPEEIGGHEILRRVAALMGRRPVMIRIPFVTPRLSSVWIRGVSGVDYRLARELVEGLTSEILAARGDFWSKAGLPTPVSLEVAGRRALEEDARAESESARIVERAVGWVTRRA